MFVYLHDCFIKNISNSLLSFRYQNREEYVQNAAKETAVWPLRSYRIGKIAGTTIVNIVKKQYDIKL